MKSAICAFGLLLTFGFSPAHAKTILISDIDDTIKISHVLDKTEAVKNAFRTDNVFGGMSSLYRALKLDNPDLKFFYVTNAPKQIMQRYHTEFLIRHSFPKGGLRLRPSLFEDNFKVTEVRKILKTEEPTTVILIGDNGEKDPVVYAQIQKENPQIRFLTYIHIDYYSRASEDRGASLKPGQIAYVTSWDLLLQLRQQAMVTEASANQFLKYFSLVFLQESQDLKVGSVVIPAWMDCRDFSWTAQDQNLVEIDKANLVREKILNRCSHAGIED